MSVAKVVLLRHWRQGRKNSSTRAKKGLPYFCDTQKRFEEAMKSETKEIVKVAVKWVLIITAIIFFIILVNRPSKEDIQSKKQINTFFNSTIAPTTFYQSLTPARKKVIKELVLNEMGWWHENWEPTKHGIKGKEIVFSNGWNKWEFPLKLNEVQFLRDKGCIIEPQWPGYITYRAENGIFILIPEED